MSDGKPCPLDHLVMPVADLAVARRRMSQLGFTVAADATHPFGTANACIFLADKTYLEPLVVADPAMAEAAIGDGNVFVARDRLFRKTAEEGLSAIVALTPDAEMDHQAFLAADISGGRVLEFGRVMRLPDGAEMEARFRLAFATHPDVGRLFLFGCQRLQPLPSDRGSLEAHANSVTGLKQVTLQADDPARFAGWFELVFGATSHHEGENIVIQTANRPIRIERKTNELLCARSIAFSVADLEVTAEVLAANGVAYQRRPSGLSVMAAPGQGLSFEFEENDG
ncbi:VOC family protein [Allorhizobium undicola]|uniref:VOC family protein n=1 Tax=Allorhizobium undicola TaxID=78527 RepID=UPI000485AAED|nr:VOC family protein [Allorhizobium undicola]